MATQVLELDRATAAPEIGVRSDVDTVFVVVTENGRPLALKWIPRPRSGVLSTADILNAVPPQVRSLGSHTAFEPISIIVCTHERPDDLARCLESLNAARGDGHEVIVIDSGPTTSRTRAVAERFGVRSATESRRGLNRARNRGVAVARHDIVAFVDDDVVVTREWPGAIRAAFAAGRVGCATGLVLPLELETAAQEQFELYCQSRRDFEPHTYSRATLRPSAAGVVGMGANMAFRKSALIAAEGFDLRLDAGTRTRSGGDTDMFASVLDHGWEIVYTPDAVVWHRHRRTVAELRSCAFGYGVGLFSMLTKRVVEHRDAAALITAARWLVGPLVKAARARVVRAAAAPWSVVLAETAGALCGPFYFARETFASRETD